PTAACQRSPICYLIAMSATEIMKQVRELPPQEVFALSRELQAWEEHLWEESVLRDSQPGGPLDLLAQQAQREIQTGQTTPLDEFLRHS
ncbi:MAG: hypothetical protein NTW03_06680, partial [Verrucomicrobia bacterium]|nr:hypothetical protein [Verrucomicrobiota bacterium]